MADVQEQNVTGSVLPDLQLQTSSIAIPLPEWARFLVNLGQLLAKFESAQDRIIASLVMPTRALAAALILVGVVIERSSSRVTSIDSKAHFERLRRLPLGTPLIFFDNGKRKRALFQGECINTGEVCLRVQTQGYDKRGAGGLVHFVNCRAAGQIFAAPADADWRLPKSQRGRAVLGSNSLLRLLLKGVDPYEFAATSRLEGAVLGVVRLIRSEVEQTRLAVTEKPWLTGTLQDVIRLRKFNSSPADGYRSDILPIDRRTLPEIDNTTNPQVVIFDGSNSLIRWRHRWGKTNWCVILDLVVFLTAITMAICAWMIQRTLSENETTAR
jgi:hypothetical protein